MHTLGEGAAAQLSVPDRARPAVSVIVPYGESAVELELLCSALGRLRLRDGDEIIIVDNSLDQNLDGAVLRPGQRLLRADHERSSYYARNVGAARAANEWLLFVDADCRPREPGLLDVYLRSEPPPDIGAVGGEIRGMPEQREFTARYSRARRYLDQAIAVADDHMPFAVTANLLVRRAAWAQVGGFCEGIRSAGDREFCFRLQRAGWRLTYHEAAAVEHRDRTTLHALLAVALRYAAGAGWLRRREASPPPRPKLMRWIPRRLAAAAGHLVLGRPERSLFGVVDVLYLLAWGVGYTMENRPRPAASGRSRPNLVVVLDLFPDDAAGWTADAVRAWGRQGLALRIEAAHRSARPLPWTIRDLDVYYLEDDGLARAAAAFVRLAATDRAALRRALRVSRRRRNGGAGALARELRLRRAGAPVVRGVAPTSDALRVAAGGAAAPSPGGEQPSSAWAERAR